MLGAFAATCSLVLTEFLSEVNQVFVTGVYNGGTRFVQVSPELDHSSPPTDLSV